MAKVDKLWTPAEDDLLRELVPTGLSYREIGERLGRTKSSTLAKAKRLGLAGLAPKKEAWNKGLGRNIWKPKKSVKPRPAPILPQIDESYQCVAIDHPADAQNIPFAEMSYGRCWFPEGETPAEMTFCGAKTPPGSSWCAYHRRIVYIPYQPAKRPSTRTYR